MTSCFTILLSFLLTINALIAAPLSYNVRDYGATGQKSDNATTAFARAIGAAKLAGGGVVQVPPGDYSCLRIVLFDNITLQLDAGAVVFTDLADPDFVTNSGFIYAENATNIAITGRGKIDGQAKYEWADYITTDTEIEAEVAIARQANVPMKRSYRVGKCAFTILFKECRGITLTDFTIENSSLWAVRCWGSNQVTIRGITILSDLQMGVNSDGIDLDGTSNAHISGCTISTGDDAICLKTGRWVSGETRTYPTENIIVSDCILSSSSAAMKIGSETFAPVRHVLFTNCVVQHANRGISINVQDGATVSDIKVANISMDLRRRHWNWWGSGDVMAIVLKKRKPESLVGTIKNITLNNITAHAQGTSRIVSLVDKSLENISINNVQVFMEAEATPDKRTRNALLIDRVDGLTLDNVAVHWDDEKPEPGWQSGLILNKVSNFRLRRVSARQAQQAAALPAISLTDCQNGVVSECVAQPGTGTYLSIVGANTRNLLVHTNYLKNARIPLFSAKNLPKNIVTYTPFP